MTREKKRNKRKRKSILFLSCEGRNRTEILYFKKSNDSNVNVKDVKGNDTDPEKMVKHLLQEMQECDFDPKLGDRAFCLVDADLDPKKDKQIRRADKLAEGKNAEVIVSNPCFEVWFLCHYVFSTAQFRSNDEVIEKLISYHPNFSKSYPNMALDLESKVGQAIKNAKKLEKHCICNGKKRHCLEFSPSTEVYKIIEVLK